MGLTLLLTVAAIVFSSFNRPLGRTIENSLFVLIFGFMGVVGAMIAARLPGNAVGWIFLAVGVSAGLAFSSDEYSTYALVTNPDGLPGGEWAAWVAEWAWIILVSMPFTFLLLLFPDGRLPSRRWRPLAWVVGIFIGLVALVFAVDPTRIGRARVPNPIGVEAMRDIAAFLDGPGYGFLMVMGLACASSLVFRFRRADGRERQQIKWFGFAAAVFVAYFVLDAVREALGIRGGFLFNTLAPALAFASLPAGVGIAMLRHRLYDVDLVIKRTLVFGVLAAVITAIYLGIVVGIGTLVGSGGSLPLSIAATATIALAFQPLRERARRFADRLVYGKRATPYEVMSEFAERAAGTYSIDEVLPRMAEIVASGTGARRAAVWLRVGGELRRTAVFPQSDETWPHSVPASGDEVMVPDADATVPVRHRGEVLGAVTVAMPPTEPLTAMHEKLLADVASQAGLVLRNVRLIEDLRASRQRLVAAQDEERRRLERNIHDGAQQQLVALAVKLRLVETLAPKDPEKAAEMAAQAKAEVQDALENLRDLARGIYPPLLADQGLAAALEAQARKAAVPVAVHPDGVGRYPQEVEAGAYFCVLEALQNVAKYAEASRVDVRLRADNGELVFEVSDDGRGFDPQRTPAGSGLTNMRDRLEALGGSVDVTSRPGEGTTVRGRIPVKAGKSP